MESSSGSCLPSVSSYLLSPSEQLPIVLSVKPTSSVDVGNTLDFGSVTDEDISQS